MTIIRISHNKSNPYVVLNKKVLEDNNISWAAKGLWAYLMSRPDDWNISVSHLTKIYAGKGGGEDAIYTILNELIEYGYCARKRVRDEQGKYTKHEYVISEFSQKCPHNEYEPHRAQPDLDEPDLVQPPTTNKGYVLNKEKQQTACGAAAVFFDCLKEIDIPVSDKVWLTKKYSEALVQEAIKWATHPGTKISKTLQQALKWFCANPVKINKSNTEISEENKSFAKKIESYVSNFKDIVFSSLNKYVEILHPSGKGAEYIEYENRCFRELIDMKLKKYGIPLPA